MEESYFGLIEDVTPNILRYSSIEVCNNLCVMGYVEPMQFHTFMYNKCLEHYPELEKKLDVDYQLLYSILSILSLEQEKEIDKNYFSNPPCLITHALSILSWPITSSFKVTLEEFDSLLEDKLEKNIERKYYMIMLELIIKHKDCCDAIMEILLKRTPKDTRVYFDIVKECLAISPCNTTPIKIFKDAIDKKVVLISNLLKLICESKNVYILALTISELKLSYNLSDTLYTSLYVCNPNMDESIITFLFKSIWNGDLGDKYSPLLNVQRLNVLYSYKIAKKILGLILKNDKDYSSLINFVIHAPHQGKTANLCRAIVLDDPERIKAYLKSLYRVDGKTDQKLLLEAIQKSDLKSLSKDLLVELIMYLDHHDEGFTDKDRSEYNRIFDECLDRLTKNEIGDLMMRKKITAKLWKIKLILKRYPFVFLHDDYLKEASKDNYCISILYVQILRKYYSDMKVIKRVFRSNVDLTNIFQELLEKSCCTGNRSLFDFLCNTKYIKDVDRSTIKAYKRTLNLVDEIINQ